MFLFIFSKICLSEYINASCKFINDKIVIVEHIEEDAIAWAYWNNSLDQIGWYKLHIKGNEKITDSSKIMKCAGALEGYVSHDSIYNHFNLIFDIQEWERKGKYPIEIRNFLELNLKYTRESIEAYSDSPFWQTLSLIMNQFDGLVSGYQMKEKDPLNPTMTEFDLWFIQSEGDMFDISEIYPNAVQQKEKVGPGAHCTGMIRLLPDYSDIYFSHDAWSDFRELHGELKEYDLPIKEFKSNRITMSTRIGKLSSYDDFYINDKGLFVLETTLSNFNDDLYELVVPQRLFTWIRAIHATWTSDNGKEWTENFIKYNSGTYNNQYLIIDSKKFNRYEKPNKDLLWIIEQFPGIYKSQDITNVLINDGYFPSINTPWFEDLFILAKYPEKISSWKEDGNYWDYKTSSRYLLMKREASRLNDFDTFKSFMRYNDWKRDLYSNGDAGQMILARYDQRLGYLPHFPKKMFGGLDTKALKLTEAITKMHFHGLASPEYINNPVFNFEDWPQYNHDGLPNKWKFNWTTFESMRPDICNKFISKESCIENNYCGWCTYDQKCLSGDKISPFFNIKCEAGWDVKQTYPKWANFVILMTCIVVSIFVIMVYMLHYYNEKILNLPK